MRNSGRKTKPKGGLKPPLGILADYYKRQHYGHVTSLARITLHDEHPAAAGAR